MCEDKGRYQNSAGADSPKSAPETEVLVPRAKHFALIDVTSHQGQATHESLPAVEGTPPYFRCEGGLTDKNKSVSSNGTLRMDMKTSSSWVRKSSPLRSSISTRMTRFMLKHCVRRRRRFQGCREAITLPTSWFGGGCPIRGMTPLNFYEKGLKTSVRVYRGCATGSCEIM